MEFGIQIEGNVEDVKVAQLIPTMMIDESGEKDNPWSKPKPHQIPKLSNAACCQSCCYISTTNLCPHRESSTHPFKSLNFGFETNNKNDG